MAASTSKLKTRFFQLQSSAHYERVVQKDGSYKKGPAARRRYVKGEIVPSTEDLAAKFGNKFVEVNSGGKNLLPDPTSAPAPAAEGHDDAGTNLEIKHSGGGRWNVINTETGEKVNDAPMTKEDAEALVAGNYEEPVANPESDEGKE